MADRIHSYPMFPQNLPSNSLQQSQIPQQPPQAQQPDPQMISTLSNPEHSRMWPQMNPLQGPYRTQQLGDLTASQVNQMQEFARGRALSHGQGQPIVQQIQQSFGLNAQRINPSGPVFHDPQANLSQLLMASNSQSVPMNTQQQMKATFNMNPILHGSLNNLGVSRQLKMLTQQEMVRLQQSNLGAQHASNQPNAVDMFATPPMQPSQDQIHGSPHHAAQSTGPPGVNQGIVSGNQQSNVSKMTPAEFQEKRRYYGAIVSQTESHLAGLVQNAHNAGSVDPLMQQRIAQLRTDLAKRKGVYENFVTTFGAMVTQQMANSIPPSNMPHINPMVHSTSQQSQSTATPNPQAQPGFVAQANQPVVTPYNLPARSPMPPQGQGGLNQQIPMAVTPVGRPNTIPPGGTPHQISGGQLPNTPHLGNFAPQSGQKVPSPNQTRQSGAIMPLDKPRFDSTYNQFCLSQGIPISPDGCVPLGEGRSVELHQLHTHVVRAGGASHVTQRDMWTAIGGQLGFVQFPGNGTEPARSGPGIAQQLHNTYERYLQHFENAYIQTVKNRPPGVASPQQQMHQPSPSSLAIGNNTTPAMSGNTAEMASNPRPVLNQQQLIWAVRFAHSSAQEMRSQRVSEQMINFVEHHRPELVRIFQHQMQIAKRNAEQEQQNNVSAQGHSTKSHERAPIGLQPAAQRPLQPMGANGMVGVPSGDVKMVNGSFVQESVAAALNQPLPSHDQVRQAAFMVSQLKHMFQQRNFSSVNILQIADEQRLEYNQLFEQVSKMTSELDERLHMYLAVFRDEALLRQLVVIVMTVAKQRQLLTASPPQYIISLSHLRNMQMRVYKFNEEFENRWRVMKASAQTATNSHQPLSVRKNPPSPLAVPPTQNTSQIPSLVPSINGRQALINTTPPQQTHLHPPPSHPQVQPSAPPQSHTPSQAPPPVSQPTKRPFSSIPPSPSAAPTIASIASPTLALASSSTPATNAPTPQTAAASPQTPKSPPSKVAGKSKSTNRMTRKLSTAGKGSATPEAVSSVAGVKRPPEEDVSAITSAAPSEAEASNAPSPKKVKTEWEGETSAALLKKQQEVENIKTDEDAAAFLDCMTEYLMTGTTDENHRNIASTLGQIFAGVAQEPADAAATAAALSVHGAGNAGPPPTALSPHLGPTNDAFLLEFLDFSSFTTLDDEDNDSKAPTPDLVPSSETNPSPESGSEGESLGSSGSLDKTKIEEPGDRSDSLRLGSLREIDGGESAYYQADNWKWEGPMHTLDQPWAIFTS